jgi:SulP family sulfate permease
MSNETQVELITANMRDDDEFQSRDMSEIKIPQGVEGIRRFTAHSSSGAVAQFRESIRVIGKKPKVLILRMRNVSNVDASGLHILEELAARRARARLYNRLLGSFAEASTV